MPLLFAHHRRQVFSHRGPFNVFQQTVCLVVNPITVGKFAFFFNCTPVGLTSDSLWRFRRKDLSIDEIWRCGFLLLWNSVLCTVESLSLLYLLFRSWFICSRRWCMDKLGVFHAKPNIYMSWSTVKLALRETGLSPPVKYFYWPFQGSTSFMDHLCYLCIVFVMLLWLFIAALWLSEEKGLTSWLSFVMYIVILLLFHLVPGQVWYLIVLITDPCCFFLLVIHV